MSELQETQEKLDEVLTQIPVSGSFESARLAKQASRLADRILALCSHPDKNSDVESASQAKTVAASS